MRTGPIIIAVVAILIITVYFLTPGHLRQIPTPTTTARPTTSPRPTHTPSTSTTPTATPIGTLTPTPSPWTSPTPGGIQTYNVSITDSGYIPATLTVVRGDIVIFTNNSVFSQTVTAYGQQFDSHTVRPGDQYRLNTANLMPASYVYRSTAHTTLRGTLIVQ